MRHRRRCTSTSRRAQQLCSTQVLLSLIHRDHTAAVESEAWGVTLLTVSACISRCFLQLQLCEQMVCTPTSDTSKPTQQKLRTQYPHLSSLCSFQGNSGVGRPRPVPFGLHGSQIDLISPLFANGQLNVRKSEIWHSGCQLNGEGRNDMRFSKVQK